MSSSIVFVQHPTTPQRPQLSYLGREGVALAKRRREMLTHPRFHVGFCSPFEGPRQALVVLAGGKILTGTIPELVHNLDTPEGELIEQVLKEFRGFEGPEDTLGAYLVGTEPATCQILIDFGTKAWNTLVEKLVNIDSTHVDVLVVGHPVLLWFLIRAAYPNGPVKMIENLCLKGCEGARLTFDNAGNCTSMEMLVG